MTNIKRWRIEQWLPGLGVGREWPDVLKLVFHPVMNGSIRGSIGGHTNLHM